MLTTIKNTARTAINLLVIAMGAELVTIPEPPVNRLDRRNHK